MRTVLLALMLLVGSCTNERPIEDIPLTDLNGAQTSIDLAAHRITVIAFLSPECPLCISYSRNLKATHDTICCARCGADRRVCRKMVLTAGGRSFRHQI
jgi:hypothetical protein